MFVMANFAHPQVWCAPSVVRARRRALPHVRFSGATAKRSLRLAIFPRSGPANGGIRTLRARVAADERAARSITAIAPNHARAASRLRAARSAGGGQYVSTRGHVAELPKTFAASSCRRVAAAYRSTTSSRAALHPKHGST
jgi:hypothetical protein